MAPSGQDSHSLRTSIHERIHTCTRINDLQISLLTHARTQSRAACFFRAWCIHFTFPVCIKFNLKHHFDFFLLLLLARARERSVGRLVFFYIYYIQSVFIEFILYSVRLLRRASTYTLIMRVSYKQRTHKKRINISSKAAHPLYICLNLIVSRVFSCFLLKSIAAVCMHVY